MLILAIGKLTLFKHRVKLMNFPLFSDVVTIGVSVFFLFNSIGQLPMFLALLAPYEHKRQKKIITRELIIAGCILFLFAFFGDNILHVLGISRYTVGMAGGLLLVLISLTLIFPKESTTKGLPHHEPMIVPLAMPGLAGPGSIAAVMLYASQYGILATSAGIFLAWIPSLAILLGASYIRNYLGEKGMQAVERLGGMLICLVGVDMLAHGCIQIVKEAFAL
jgi:multiple antibiotic resistance protein